MAGGIALLATLGLSFAAFAGPSQDSDGDGVYDVLDNCLDVQNAPPLDCDTDNDGYGNRCDGDMDNDFFVFPSDYDLWLADSNAVYDSGIGSDMDCDGYVFPSDYDLWLGTSVSVSVGPSGLHCAGTVPCDL
jgi:hypothetical protein